MAEVLQTNVAPGGLLQKGLSIIELLVSAHQPISLTQIAEASGIDISSALRILKVLAADGYVLREPMTKLYAPGPRALYPLDLNHPLTVYRRSAQPLLRSRVDSTGFTTGLHLFVHGERLAIEILPGSRTLTPFFDTQAQRPPHVSATGKLFLLTLDEDRRAALLGEGPYTSHGDGSITDPRRLAEELARARELGYASAVGEAYPWLWTVAAPITTRNGVTIGAFAVFGMTDYLDADDIPALGEKLKQAAEIFSHSCPALDAVERLVSGTAPRSDRALLRAATR